VRFRLTPRDVTFFDLFATNAQHLVDGADLLAQLIGAEPPERPAHAARLREIEQEADGAKATIMNRLNQTFVTPFDRDDIYTLTAAMDDCIDSMEAAGDIIVRYQIIDLPDGVVTMVATLQRAAELTAAAMPRLRTMTDLKPYWVEINRLESEANRTYRALLAHLFGSPQFQRTPADVVELIKLKDVVDVLEQAADAFERVGSVVQTIYVKET
jgi:predicted phosphate transport protein (TIGR00153 family)